MIVVKPAVQAVVWTPVLCGRWEKVYQYKGCYLKDGEMRFLSHLELMRTFIRAIRRAEIPVLYSQGFNPQPRLSFAAPLPVGMEGKNEYFDLFLSHPWEAEKLKTSLNKELPRGLKIKKIEPVKSGSPVLSAMLVAALYAAELPASSFELQEGLQAILKGPSLIKVRRDGEKVKKVDIRPLIYDLKIKEAGGKIFLLMLLAAGSRGGVKPREILESLPLEGDVKVYRLDLFIREGNTLRTPEGLRPEDYLQDDLLLCPSIVPK